MKLFNIDDHYSKITQRSVNNVFPLVGSKETYKVFLLKQMEVVKSNKWIFKEITSKLPSAKTQHYGFCLVFR